MACGGLLGAAVAVAATTSSAWAVTLAAPALAVGAVLVTTRLRALEVVLVALGVSWIVEAFVTRPGSSSGLQRSVVGASALAAIAATRWRPAMVRAAGGAAEALAHRLQAEPAATSASAAIASPLRITPEPAQAQQQDERGEPQPSSGGTDLLSTRLSQRQREVIGLVLEGLTAREIGARLFISERTVETHIANVYERLDIHSRHQLLRSQAGVRLQVMEVPRRCRGDDAGAVGAPHRLAVIARRVPG